MSMLVLAAVLAAAPMSPPAACERYVVEPGPDQGMHDAALVRAASKHDASPRSLGVTLANVGWRIVWARPEDSEPGIFFFSGPQGHERFVDVWGGPTSDRRGAYRWATKIGAPPALAHCFADRLVDKGL